MIKLLIKPVLFFILLSCEEIPKKKLSTIVEEKFLEKPSILYILLDKFFLVRFFLFIHQKNCWYNQSSTFIKLDFIFSIKFAFTILLQTFIECEKPIASVDP